MASASSAAMSAWLRIEVWNSSMPPASMPPVSISRKSTPFQSALVVAAVARDTARLVHDGVGLSA